MKDDRIKQVAMYQDSNGDNHSTKEAAAIKQNRIDAWDIIEDIFPETDDYNHDEDVRLSFLSTIESYRSEVVELLKLIP